MNYLDILGAEELLGTPENMNIVFNYVIHKGKVFKGYSGFYCYNNLGYAEISLHIQPDAKTHKNVLIGMNTHVMGDWFWNDMMIGNRQLVGIEKSDKDVEDGEQEEDLDSMSKVVFICAPDDESVEIPVNLVMPDVLPSFEPGERFDLQVGAFALDPHYYESESTWETEHGMVVHETKIGIKNGTILNFGFDSHCVVKARVKEVDQRFTFNLEGERIDFLCVVLETDFGDLPIYHRMEAVPEDEQQWVKPGACFFGTCDIQGDVAVHKYQQGAVYDESCNLKVLKGAYNSLNFTRGVNLFADDAIYDSKAMNRHIVGKENILAQLVSVTENLKLTQRTQYAYMGFVRGKNEPKRSCLLLAVDEPYNFTQIMFCSVNDIGKVCKIEYVMCTDYDFEVSYKLPEACSFKTHDKNLLCLMKECFDSEDWLPMLSFMSLNVTSTEGNDTFALGKYTLIQILDKLFRDGETRERQALHVYVAEATPIHDKTPHADAKRLLGLALSSGTLEEYQSFISIDVGEDGKIHCLHNYIGQVFTVKELPIENEICKHDNNHRRVYWLKNTPEKWLEFIRNLCTEEEHCDRLLLNSSLEPEVSIQINDNGVIETITSSKEVHKRFWELFDKSFSRQPDIVTKPNGERALALQDWLLSVQTGPNEKIMLLKLERIIDC